MVGTAEELTGLFSKLWVQAFRIGPSTPLSVHQSCPSLSYHHTPPPPVLSSIFRPAQIQPTHTHQQVHSRLGTFVPLPPLKVAQNPPRVFPPALFLLKGLTRLFHPYDLSHKHSVEPGLHTVITRQPLYHPISSILTPRLLIPFHDNILLR